MTTRSTSASAASALRSGRLAGEARGGRARSHDQRADARERRGDRVRQAEGQKVGLRIGTQHAERQHHQPRERLRQRRACRRRPRRERRAARSAIASADGGRSGGRLASARRMHAIDGGNRGRAGQRRRLFVQRRRAESRRPLRPANAGRPASISKRMAPAANRSAARVDGLAHHLLGRHVARRADHDAGARQPADPSAGSELRPRETEVEQLDAVRREEDVGRLEIAMDDAARVQRRQRGQHAEADRHRLRDAHRPALQPLGERLALEQLHGDEQLAGVLADLVDLADVRMVDARRGAGLAPEPLARRLVRCDRRHRLQRDGALAAARRAPRRRHPSRLRRACGRSRSGRCAPADLAAPQRLKSSKRNRQATVSPPSTRGEHATTRGEDR